MPGGPRPAAPLIRVKRAGLALLFGLALGGCIDTDLGLAFELGATDVSVASGQVTGSFEVTYRVGEFAEMGESFNPRDVQLFVDGDLIALISVSTPPGFEPRVEPGESRTTTLSGMASAAEADRLCGANVDVVVTYIEGLSRETRLFEATTSAVTCM